MLDIKNIRENLEEIVKRLNTRGQDYSIIKDAVELDIKRREKIAKGDELKNFRNEKSKEIGVLKKKNLDASLILKEVDGIGNDIANIDKEIAVIDEKIFNILKFIPNTPNISVKLGKSEADNVLIRKVGRAKKLSFKAKAHWELGVDLNILDFERATKISGPRFVIYYDAGARLERALMNFMLDMHIYKHGYSETSAPFMVNGTSMYGTGQLPKFAEDAFKIEGLDYYMIPTSEVSITNIHSGEILSQDKLPLKRCSFSPCFRLEAGSAGRDTRGIIRLHQFQKVELVWLANPAESYHALEALTADAEDILKALKLPYRVIELCTGDMGFSSAKTYDIEVWLPSYQAYKEISSCSNFEDFQARRANIKFRNELTGKAEYVHTLNGSGLAIGRTVAAIMENYQQEDGSILIPKVLIPYMKTKVISK